MLYSDKSIKTTVYWLISELASGSVAFLFISTNSGSWKLNIAHLGLTNVDVGDLLVMPLQALPSVDPLPADPFLVDPLPIDDFYNDSFPIDLLPADLDQAFMLHVVPTS